MPTRQEQPLVEIGPFEGLNTWASPWYMKPSLMTDISFVQFDETLGGVATAKGRSALFTGLTDPLGMDVFYRSGTGKPFMVVVADGVWKLVDYQDLTALVNFTLPASGWDAAAQTYFIVTGSSIDKGTMLATNGVSTPLVVLDDFNPATPTARKAGLTTPATTPTAAAGAAGNLNGTYRWRVTFESSSHESSPGPFSLPLTITNLRVNLTAIPTSSDPATTARNVWRIGGSIPEWRLVGTIPDNIVTTAEDNISDLDLGRLLDFDRDPPQTGMTVTIAHKSRVFGFIKDDLLFSNFDEPEGWDATNTLPVGRGDDIVTLGSTGSVLLTFKRNQTWALFGETLSDFILLKIFDVGCVGPRAVASAPGEVYWLAEDGFRVSDGRQVKLVGADIYATIRDLPAAAKRTCVMAYGLGKIFAGFPDASPVVSFIYDIKTSEWEKYPFAPKQIVPLFAAVSGDPGFFAINEYPGAPPTFDIRRWPAATYGDLGSTTSWFIERKHLDSGAGKLIKTYRELEIVTPKHAGGTTVTVTLTVEDDAAKTRVLTVPLSSGPIRIGLAPELRGTYINVRAEGSHSIKIELQKLRLWGHIERGYGRDAS